MTKFNLAIQFIAYSSASVLAIMYYGWILLAILILFGWGMNLENVMKRNK
jgi:hypothetical protein